MANSRNTCVAHWRNWVAPDGIDSVTYGNDRVEIVKIHVALNLPAALGLNCSEFPNSCLAPDFALLIDILQVFANRGHAHIKQSCHQLLRQPDRLVLQSHLHALAAMQVTIHEAKTHLSKLIAAVERGQEVVIARRDKPVVRLVIENPVKPKRTLGFLAGKVSKETIDFLTCNPALDKEIEQYFMASVDQDFPR